MVYNFFNSSLFLEFCIGIIVDLAAFVSGICRSYPVFLIPQLQEDVSFINLTEDEISWLGSLTMLSMPIGCLVGGSVMEIFGRKFFLIFLYVPNLVAWILTAYAKDLSYLYIGCILNGVTAGIAQCASTYLGEVCSPKMRAVTIALGEPIFALGAVLCNVFLYNLGWKVSAQYYIAFAVLCTCSQFLLPESPNWLVRKGRIEEAKKVLLLRSTELEAMNQIFELQEYYRLLDKQESKIQDLLLHLLGVWKQLLILIGLCILQQACGFNILVAYTVIFFQHLKLPFDSNLAALIYSVVAFGASFILPFSIFYIGRKTSLIISGLGAGFSLLIVAIYETWYINSMEKPFFWIVLLCMYAYIIFISIGIMTVGFVLSSELFPSDVAGIANGVYGCFGFIIAGIVLKVFHPLLQEFGIIPTLWFLCFFSFANAPFAYFTVPETRGKTINEIQEKYFPRKSVVLNSNDTHL